MSENKDITRYKRHFVTAILENVKTNHAEIILASGDVGIRVLVKHCHGILDGKGMPEDWATSVTIPISRGKNRYNEQWHE